MDLDAPVLVSRDGRLGRITLNRPKSINALTVKMIALIHSALVEFEQDPDVEIVVVDGAGDRGFCAGGDVVALRNAVLAGEDLPTEFWLFEYSLNDYVSKYPKPYVAIMDGITMGGGVGISGHAAHRVATERSKIGMPEVAIGFIPDVGGTWLLSHTPGETGTHMALTGQPVSGHDAVAMGLADVVVDSAAMPHLIDALKTRPVAEVFDEFRIAPPWRTIVEETWISECYQGDSVADILDRLREHTNPDAQRALKAIVGKSPNALVLTLAALRRGARLNSLREALDQEFRAMKLLATTPDFVEGVRSVLVDKDRNPQWNPAEVRDVDPAIAAVLEG